MDDLFTMNPKISTALFSIIGLILVDNLTANEQNVLGNWFMLIGQILETNANSQLYIESKIINNNININSKKFKKLYNPFFYDIKTAKKILQKENISLSDETLKKISLKLKEIDIFLNNFKKNRY